MILSNIRPVYFLMLVKGSGFGVKSSGRESNGIVLSDWSAPVGGGRSRSATIGF